MNHWTEAIDRIELVVQALLIDQASIEVLREAVEHELREAYERGYAQAAEEAGY